MKKPIIRENKINNRHVDIAKVVIEVDGKVYREMEVELASDCPDLAVAFLKSIKPQLKGRDWECYISFLGY
jgi:hypothetical protein